MCAFARTLPTDAAKCFNCSGSSLSGCRPACCLCPLPFAIRCSLLSIRFSLFCSVCSVASLLSVRYSHSGFTTRHSQSANPLAAAKLSLVVVTHCVLVMRHTQLYRLPLALHAARCTPVACRLPVVGCFVSSVNVCVSVCLYVCVYVCVFNYKMSDKLKIKFTARLILSILVLNSTHSFFLS